jgi:hypothetical protein
LSLSMPGGAGASGLSWNELSAPPIGTCRVGAGAGRRLIYWARPRAGSKLGPSVCSVFGPEPKKLSGAVLGSILGAPVEMLLGPIYMVLNF